MVYQKTEWKDHVVDQSTGKLIQQGTPVSAKNLNNMEAGIESAHNILEQSSRQSQALKTGVQIVNGDVTSPANIQMEGRTLIPMQNSVLESLKYYVLAETNYKIKYLNGEQIAGIAKFQGKGEQPAVIRVASFEGKRSGSTLENPHIMKRTQYEANGLANTLLEPSNNNFIEADDNILTRVTALDGNTNSLTNTKNGNMSQVLLAFDLVQEIERRLGRIPRNTLTDKVQWCKDNINYIAFRWYGYGSSPSGNKAYLKLWQPGTSSYYGTGASHTSNTTAVLTGNVQKDTGTLKTTDIIDSTGFVYALAHADASDGNTPSTLVTDYVSLEIELKRDAILLDPRVPLYEVSKEEYDNILATWTADEVVRRYPPVAGVQHIQNPFVMVEGENLLPPFSDWVVSNPNNARHNLLGPYEFEFNVDGAYTYSITYNVKVVPGQKYTFNAEQINNGSNVGVVIRSADGTITIADTRQVDWGNFTFTVPTAVTEIYVRLFNSSLTIGTRCTVKNPILTLGDKVKPFEPYNPSYLFVSEKLGSMNGIYDLLYESDGSYWLRHIVEKDYVLDGTRGWTISTGADAGVGRKIARVTLPNAKSNSVLTKYNGAVLPSTLAILDKYDIYRLQADGVLFVSIYNADSGFSDAYAPVADELKAYFNGWKVKTTDAAGKPTAWVSVVDGSDAPTQTLAYVAANKALGYTPYKISYLIATPVVKEAKVEGAININGATQVTVGAGVIVREKANFVINGQNTSYNINSNTIAGTALKYSVAKFLGLYKGNTKSNDYFLVRDQFAIGYERMGIDKDKFDPTVEYYVTYLAWDKQLITTNPVDMLINYANNVRTALEETTKKAEDNSREITVQANILYDVLKRLKAGGL